VRPRDVSDEAPNPEEEEASLAGLALSPWVAERAKIERQKHYELRRGEADRTTDSKESKWNRGMFAPQGGR
jgi:hypothetical protein